MALVKGAAETARVLSEKLLSVTFPRGPQPGSFFALVEWIPGSW